MKNEKCQTNSPNEQISSIFSMNHLQRNLEIQLSWQAEVHYYTRGVDKCVISFMGYPISLLCQTQNKRETGLQWTYRLVSKIISYQLEVYKGYYDKAVTPSRAVSCNACLEVSVDDFPLILQLKLPVVDRIHPQSNKFVTRYREQGYRWLKT